MSLLHCDLEFNQCNILTRIFLVKPVNIKHLSFWILKHAVIQFWNLFSCYEPVTKFCPILNLEIVSDPISFPFSNMGLLLKRRLCLAYALCITLHWWVLHLFERKTFQKLLKPRKISLVELPVFLHECLRSRILMWNLTILIRPAVSSHTYGPCSLRKGYALCQKLWACDVKW